MKALIIGRARGVWEEVAAAQAMTTFDATIVVGKAAIDYPGRIDHWVTFHTELFDVWEKVRRGRGFPDPTTYWSAIYKGRPRNGPDRPGLRLVRCNGGASGMIGVVVALDELCVQRAVLAGIPMQDDRGHYDETKDWNEAAPYRTAWVEEANRMIGRVRSMSGWTMNLLGGEPPTREWLEAAE